MNSKKFRNLVRHLNKLRGKKAVQKPKTRNSNKISNKLPVETNKIYTQGEKKFVGKVSPTSKFHVDSFNSKRNIMLKPITIKHNVLYEFRVDPKIESILKIHKTFLKFQPILPISDSPKEEKVFKLIPIIPTPIDIKRSNSCKLLLLGEDPRRSSNTPTYNNIFHHGAKKISCDFHKKTRLSQPCIDCFLKYYFGEECSDPEVSFISKKFKNCYFPSFDKLEFEVMIENTEIPLF